MNYRFVTFHAFSINFKQQSAKNLSHEKTISRQSLVWAAILVVTGMMASPLSHAQDSSSSKTLVPNLWLPDSSSPQTPSANRPSSSSIPYPEWHVAIAPYLWFPGVHGTVGALGRESSVHASAADLLSNFRFGLMGLVDARYKRYVMPLDFMWTRLGDESALPFPNLPATSADVKVSEFVLTPKVGFRIVDRPAFKIDALTGFRYWHFGQDLAFRPSTLGLNFSSSQNWVDPLVGGRIITALSPKTEASIAGDVGGWGAGSQLDYQIAGLLGYRVKPKWTLQAGYRYLDVDYRSGGTRIDTVTSGVLFGVSINLK
jgi:hypothetical protein